MEIRNFTLNYYKLIEEKLQNELKKSLEEAEKQDKIYKMVELIKSDVKDRLLDLNNTLIEEGEGPIFSSQGFKYLEIEIPLQITNTKTTIEQKQMLKDNTRKRLINFKKKLEEVESLASYLTTSEEVTKLLKNYDFINDKGKLNMDIV